jgi:hypothetical protein
VAQRIPHWVTRKVTRNGISTSTTPTTNRDSLEEVFF